MQSEQAYTLMEMLVTLSISTFLFAGLMAQYSIAASTTYDQNIRMATNLQTQAILQSIGSEIRILGNGVPFDQANFQIGETTLSDPTVADPIQIATATATNISFRLNESGEVHLLTADFNPATSSTINLTAVNDLDVNDPIYLSNGVVSGDDGLYGIITAVDSGTNSITIGSNYIASPGATFAMGSMLEEVPLINFNSPTDGSGVVRDSGFGTVLMAPNSTMLLEYFDIDGNAVTLPLTNQTVMEDLRAIRVTITLTASQPLSDGDTYNATAQQTFGLRNLTYVF